MNKCELLFEHVHSLISTKRYSVALNILLNNKGEIRDTFDDDRNHAWYLVGDIWFKQKRFRNALFAFRRAIHEYGSDADSYWAIADCYSALGIYKMAEKYYRKSLFLRKRKEVIYDLANAIYDQKKYVESIKLYKQVQGFSALGLKARHNLVLAKNKMARVTREAGNVTRQAGIT
jgi:tetratricopeptide (TPR) repeat protein